MGGPLDYSTTAASNTTVGGVSIAEGMAPGNVNNGMRAMMADSRKWQLDWSGVTTAGAGNAYTLTSNQGISAYADGMRFSFRADRANTGAVTLNVDARGAKAVRRMNGSSAVALVSGDLVAGGVYDVGYVLADDIFVVVNSFGNLPGLTATVTELNYVDGVTSAIQTQLDAKMATASYPTLVSLEGLSLVAGDILYVTAADTLARLAKGTDGQFLTLASGLPVWGTSSGSAFTWLAAISTPSGSTPADFNIPSSATEICVLFDGTDRGTAGDDFYVRLGTAASFEATGYNHFSGIPTSTGSSSGVAFVVQVGAAGAARGEMNLKYLGSNKWTQTHIVGHTTTRLAVGSGTKTLSDVLTRIRILPSSGSWAGGAVQVGYR